MERRQKLQERRTKSQQTLKVIKLSVKRRSYEDFTTNQCLMKEGWVYKEGQRVTTWKKRYLMIELDKLLYFSSSSKKRVQGTILIVNITQVKSHDGPYKNKKYVFDIATRKRTFHFQAQDEADRTSWVETLNKVHQLVLSNGAASLRATTITTGEDGSDESSGEYKKEKEQQSSDKKKLAVSAKKGVKVGLNDFVMKKVIGRGRYGKIVLVVKKDNGRVYAMKIIRKLKVEERTQIFTERDVLIKLQSPFLAKLHYTFQTSSRLYLVMEYYAGGELFWHMQKGNFTEDRTKFYAAQITSVLQYMHDKDIMYRDLKPENILLSNEGNIVLIDLGGAKECDFAETFTSFAPEYYAPEVIRGKPYSSAVDWWCLGTLIVDMMTGSPPFFSDDSERMFDLIENQEPCIPNSFSTELTDLLKKLLSKDPEKRLQCAYAIRTHPWFASIDWEKLEAKKVIPPFIPNVASPADVTNIDEAFLAENVEDSDDADGETFMSWTYVNDKLT